MFAWGVFYILFCFVFFPSHFNYSIFWKRAWPSDYPSFWIIRKAVCIKNISFSKLSYQLLQWCVHFWGHPVFSHLVRRVLSTYTVTVLCCFPVFGDLDKQIVVQVYQGDSTLCGEVGDQGLINTRNWMKVSLVEEEGTALSCRRHLGILMGRRL